MTIFFAGGERIDFDESGTEASSTSTANRDVAYARTAIGIKGLGEYAIAHIPTTADLWTHFDLKTYSSGSGRDTTVFRGDDGQALFVLRREAASPDPLRVRYWDGAAWVTVVDLTAPTSRKTFDIHTVVHAMTGSFTVYENGVVVAQVSNIDTTNGGSATGVNAVELRSSSSSGEDWYSQVIVADENTIGWKLRTTAPDASGATSGFTGTVSDIDETDLNDSDFITGATGATSTFAQSAAAVSVLDGFDVAAVVQHGRVRAGVGEDAQLVMRSAGTDYPSASLGVNAAFSNHTVVHETDPATSTAWTKAAALAFEQGVKAV